MAVVDDVHARALQQVRAEAEASSQVRMRSGAALAGAALAGAGPQAAVRFFIVMRVLQGLRQRMVQTEAALREAQAKRDAEAASCAAMAERLQAG
jgi:hypothetical protein